MCKDTEIWLPIRGYEGLYEISNLGRVCSIGYGERKIIKPIFIVDYYRVNLYKDKKCKHFLLHRLIAIHFIINSNDLSEVNHIDGNKLNNALSNLEWVTHAENMRHAYNTGLNKRGKPVNQICLQTGKIFATYKSAREATCLTGINNIIACCKGRISHAGGFGWQYT